jgi:hypothetical protein
VVSVVFGLALLILSGYVLKIKVFKCVRRRRVGFSVELTQARRPSELSEDVLYGCSTV